MNDRLQVKHLKGARFSRRGLRGYFEYRDLGIKRATRGKVVAHVIRARAGKAPHGEWHLQTRIGKSIRDRPRNVS